MGAISRRTARIPQVFRSSKRASCVKPSWRLIQVPKSYEQFACSKEAHSALSYGILGDAFVLGKECRRKRDDSYIERMLMEVPLKIKS